MSDYILMVDDSWVTGRKNFVEGPASSMEPEKILPSWGDGARREFFTKSAAPAAMDILGVINEYAGTLKSIEDVQKGMQVKAALDNIQKQLAPDQRVTVLVDLETGEALEIQRPGGGNLFDPKKRSEFKLVGDDDFTCWSDSSEATEFKVLDGKGAPKTLRLDEGLWKREGISKEKNEDDSRERERDNDRPRRNNPKSEQDMP